jgi:hypothetical protein
MPERDEEVWRLPDAVKGEDVRLGAGLLQGSAGWTH